VLAFALSACLADAEVVGKTTGPLDATKAREAESSLGNLVADAARASLKAEIALVPASQLRDVTLPAGDLTREALSNALLYPDEKTVLVEVTGAQVRAALERGLSMLPGKPNAAFLQVSGLAVTFRSDAPEGQRVLGVQVGGSALVAERNYKAAMPSSLAKGALGYFRVFDGLKPTQTGAAISDAVVDLVRGKTISPQSGRLRDLAPPPEK
jgi:2',3'-cyclic-nucleotide 2'-phosphodiesterase (5'-nucleotidase family)